MLRSFASLLSLISFLVYGDLGTRGAKSNIELSFPVELLPLVNVLQEVGYEVNFEKPPLDGAYGATNGRQKKYGLRNQCPYGNRTSSSNS